MQLLYDLKLLCVSSRQCGILDTRFYAGRSQVFKKNMPVPCQGLKDVICKVVKLQKLDCDWWRLTDRRSTIWRSPNGGRDKWRLGHLAAVTNGTWDTWRLGHLACGTNGI